MDQFTVPQFIDSEDKILGPVTARQFIIMLVVMMVDALLFKLAPFLWFLVFGVPLFAVGVIVAFVPVNGQPFHFFLLNLVQTFRRPGLRVWDKNLTTAELRAYLVKPPEAPPAPPPRKGPIDRSRLQELTLLVNTGGMYKPE